MMVESFLLLALIFLQNFCHSLSLKQGRLECINDFNEVKKGFLNNEIWAMKS